MTNKENVIFFSIVATLLLANSANCMEKSQNLTRKNPKFKGNICDLNALPGADICFRFQHEPHSTNKRVEIIYSVTSNQKEEALNFIDKNLVGCFDLTFSPTGTAKAMLEDLNDFIEVAGDRIRSLSLPYLDPNEYCKKTNWKKLKNLKYLDIGMSTVTIELLESILDNVPSLKSLNFNACYTSSGQILSKYTLTNEIIDLQKKYQTCKIYFNNSRY